MRILVTGAGGYIGRHLVPRLRTEGHEAVEMYRQKWAAEWLTEDEDGTWHGDLARFDVDSAVQDIPTPDTVIHLAGRVEISLLPNPKGADLPPIPGPCDIGALYRDNVLATANVLDYCLKAGVKHLIFASTQAVYGMPDSEGSIFTEDSPTNPLEHYAMSKVAAERVLRVGIGESLRITTLRIPGVYGGDRKDGIVWKMCKQGFQDYEVEQTIHFPLPFDCLHIEDVVDAFVKTVAWGGYGYQVMNIATGEANDLTRLAIDIGELTKADPVEGTHRALIALYSERASLLLSWHPKPRKERLAQMLEEIRLETPSSL